MKSYLSSIHRQTRFPERRKPLSRYGIYIHSHKGNGHTQALFVSNFFCFSICKSTLQTCIYKNKDYGPAFWFLGKSQHTIPISRHSVKKVGLLIVYNFEDNISNRTVTGKFSLPFVITCLHTSTWWLI